MATTAFYTIRQRVLQRLGATQQPITGTATGGTTTTLVDSAYALSGATADDFDYTWVKIATTTDGAAPQGNVRNVTEGGYAPSTGTWTVPTVFGAAPESGDTYEFHRDFHPSEIDNIINDYLRGLQMPTYFPLSLHLLTGDDNDMETSGTSAFTATNATMAKNTTTFFTGTQSLAVTASSANGYATPGNFPVTGSRPYYVALSHSATDAKSGRLRMYDSTNSATILDSAAMTNVDWEEVMFQWIAPATCRNAQARLMSVGSGDVTYWDDYQIWATVGQIYVLPSWITRKEQVIDVVAFPPGIIGASGAYHYRASEHEALSIPFTVQRVDTRATNELSLFVDGAAIGFRRPYVIARRRLTEVSADFTGSTTTANTIALNTDEADAVVLGVLGECYARMAMKQTGEKLATYQSQAVSYSARYKRACFDLGLVAPEFKVESSRTIGTIR